MVKDVIEGIRATEAEAAGITDRARKKRGEIVAASREKARHTVEEATRQGNERIKSALDTARKDAEARIETIGADEKQKREAVRQGAARNISKAVETVIERMLG
jgi:vacuolar-type H+-ATPase subunit H